jgi:hypothetical protein
MLQHVVIIEGIAIEGIAARVIVAMVEADGLITDARTTGVRCAASFAKMAVR